MDIFKEGTLQKWTNYVYGWKSRYFVLHDGLLEYCKKKGDPLKGKISASTISLKKHPKNDNQFLLNTGLTTMNIRASNPKEAQEWYIALKKSSTIESGYSSNNCSFKSNIEELPSTLANKVSEMWTIYALISELLDDIPAYLFSNYPQIEKAMSLFKTFKILASEVLSFIDSEDTRSVFSRFSTSERKSIDPIDSEMIKYNIREIIIEDEHEDSVHFEDAKSHVSDEKEDFSAPHRNSLPFLRDPNKKINIWRVVKDSIGKDLSKMAIPVYFNEPISFLQRFSEDLTYHNILLEASESEDSLLRMAYVACFAVTSYVYTLQRHMKPFNPLLGETFENIRDGYKIVCEQVSHHPPISAIHCEHPYFTYSGSVKINTSFKGTHLLVTPVGLYHLHINKYNDHFVWSKPKTNVHNIIFGKIYVEHFGKVEIVNRNNGEIGTLVFHKKGWFGKVSNEVSGTVHDKAGNLRYKMFGFWHEKMSILDVANNKVIPVWEKYPYPEGYDYNYFFSDYAINLNVPPEHFTSLPPTDSRFRPDQRALENGDLKQALSEKHRLEEKQRGARKLLEESGHEYKPLWFSDSPDGWMYKGGYWEMRESGDFRKLPDIY